ncbi:sulfotransferase ssu-1-like [Clavelina lepadiformis]|uniref:sulfotransferase ssu-1-like n=1 Tax=Clavelina lepadiformis TaxID=159417 RepID=UPI00404307C0
MTTEATRKIPKVCHVTTPSGGSVALPTICSQETFDDAINFKFSENDVIIRTYPKSGTTWMMNIIYLITHHGKPIPGGTFLEDHFLFCETYGKERLLHHQGSPFRFFQTHIHADHMKFNKLSKYVCVVRNPKDVCVSFFHHTNVLKDLYDVTEMDFVSYFQLFVEGKTDFGSYFDHVTAALSHRDDANVLFILYEDMLADTRSAVLKVARFLGQDYLEQVQDEDVMKSILEQSSFAAMFKSKEQFSHTTRDDVCAVIRKGIVGDWKSLMTQQQAGIIDEMTRKHELDHLWKDFQ